MPPPALQGASPGRGAVALLLVLAGLPFVLGLGHPPLWDANEPFYVEPAKEALTWPEGSVWAPTWNGKTYFGHPPLATWAVVAAYAVGGIDEATGRVPGALAGIATVLAAFALGSALGGRRTGVLAALALAATPFVWLFSRELAGDALFMALMTGAFALAVRGLSGGSGRRLLAGHALVGFAALTKGPLAFVLYAPALLLTAWCARPRIPFGALKPWSGLALALLVALPWYVAMTAHFWPDFHTTFFGWHNVKRFLGDVSGRPTWYYLTTLPADGQPWISLAPLALWRLVRGTDRRPAALLPWLAAAWMLVFFSVSGGKRNIYLLPLLPLLAVGVAPVLETLWGAASRSLARGTAFLLAAIAALAAVGLVFAVRREPRLAPELYGLLAVWVVGAVALLAAGVKAAGRPALVAGLATFLGAEVAAAFALPALDRVRPIPALAARIRELEDRGAPEPAIVFRARVTSLSWYLGHRAEAVGNGDELAVALGTATRAFVICPQERVEQLRSQAPDLALAERARAPMFDFQFRRVILAERPATTDLVLFEATRPAPPPRPPGTPPPADPDPENDR